ncbi:MAG: M15 family metallopeptidase [Cyanobacteria bacterium J06614_10]
MNVQQFSHLVVRWLIGQLSQRTIKPKDLHHFEAKIFRLIGIPIGICATILALWVYGVAATYVPGQNIVQPPASVSPAPHKKSSRSLKPTSASTSALLKKPIASLAPIRKRDSHLGHLRYHEADSAKLSAAGTFIRGTFQREELLIREAAEAFKKMSSAAASEGVELIPISGFRTVADQAILFEAQIARKGGMAVASKFSAPAGYSEHHTGYAIDIGDKTQPNTDLRYAFSDTQAYRWLVRHAQACGFEQSFPEDNAQGLSFEPWHWRFIGSPHAAQTFKEAQFISNNH